ncbi:MAG: PQQ-binding-like beta-propeller repeat protein, partial [Pirellulaceae bacterium]|nr:PQQ-binding-like beta-propeller repeat protein [Pirellulaceae bacterium]
MSKYTSVIRLFDRLVLGFCGFALCLAGCDSAAKETSSNATQSQPPTASTASSNPVPEEADWSQFRGPEFTSSTSSEYRLEWAIDEGIEWKSELPGRGAATPIVVGNRIFVTAFDGFGLTVENAGELKDLRHHLLCFDKNTGQPLWQREVTGTSLLQKMNPELVRHGFASSTPVSDGQHVYVFFGVTGVFAFDLDGELLWQRNLGLETHYFGSSSSPIVYGDL